MSSIEFKLEDKKTFLIRNEQTKEISRDLLLEICQLLLSHLTSTRDYSNVTSIHKLLRIIDLECEPDESDTEPNVEPEPEESKKRPAQRRAGPRTRKSPVKNEDSD